MIQSHVLSQLAATLKGMTPHPHDTRAAAIALQVPASGEEWLDNMIRAARQQRAAEASMAMLMLHNTLIEVARMMGGKDAGSPWGDSDIATYAMDQASAMESQLRLFDDAG